jgi:hypothetical protein
VPSNFATHRASLTAAIHPEATVFSTAGIIEIPLPELDANVAFESAASPD